MNYGDFLIVVHIYVPSKISEEEKAIYGNLKEISKMSPQQEKLFKKLNAESKKNEVDY